MGRDPWVVSQVMLQILYMLPLVVLLWTGAGDPALALAPAAVVVAFQVSSSLTWLGLSGEDAPDLLGTAPVAPAVLRRGKLQAVGAVALCVAAAPLGYLASVSAAAALPTAALVLAAIAAGVALQLWHAAPGRRSAFALRHRESKLMGLVEAALSVLLGLGAALAALPTPAAVAPLVLAGAVLLVMRRGRPRAA